MSKIDWLILCLLIFIPRLPDLDVFLTIDEPLFLAHAREFAIGLSSGDWSQTLGIGYPGVTVAWWSAPFVGLGSTELGAYVLGRVATTIVTGLLLLLVYLLARLLLGRWPAFIGAALLALDPYTLSYSRLLHIAAPLALLMTLAGLAFLLWLTDGRRRWLLLTGLFTGLALLTKSTALLLGPVLGVMVAGWALGTGQWRDWPWWLTKLGGLLGMALIASATFFLLWPAMWVNPTQALALTFGKLFTDQEAGAGNLGLYWLGRFVEDPGPAFYPVALLLKSTPWLLVGLILSLWFIIRDTYRTPSNLQPTSRILIISLWLFSLTYLLLMTIASKKSIRYMLPAFPSFYLLAGWAFYQMGKLANTLTGTGQQMGKWANGQIGKYPNGHRWANGQMGKWANGQMDRWAKNLPYFLLPTSYFLLLIIFLLTFIYHPYYLTYYNPLVLGWRWAPDALLVGWGEGLDEAARYLNRRTPGPVSAWYGSIFSTFYEGQIEDVVPPENLLTADRTVLYINQVQRDIPSPNLIHYFRTRRQPEYTVRLDGIDYAWVYPGPIAGLDLPDPILQYPLGGEFGNESQLLGYNLNGEPFSGEPLIVTLYWRVLEPPPAERFVYLRLVDDQGHVWAQTDSPPVMGLWPAPHWQAGMLIEDAHELPLPPGMPPGPYRLEVGWYDPISGQVLPSRGQAIGRGGGLVLGEVEVAWQSLRTEPDLPYRTDTRLASDARLIGYDAPPAAATTGDVLPIRLAWRESKTFPWLGAGSNDLVVFEWQPSSGLTHRRPAQQLDALPLPVDQWGRGATLLSQHEVIVPPTLEAGQYDLLVRLSTGGEPAGEAFSLGSLDVASPTRQFDLPSNTIAPTGPNQLAQNITLIGYDLGLAGPSLELKLYWQTTEPITMRYKVFVQVLTPENTLVAQSDRYPADGQRPTTGWLPGEIITDLHTLSLPPDLPSGVYRLIAGLYQPITGERLPVLNEHGEVVADAIFIGEVTIP